MAEGGGKGLVLDPKILNDDDDGRVEMFTMAALQAILSRPAWQRVQGNQGGMFAQYPEPGKAAVMALQYGIITATAFKQGKAAQNAPENQEQGGEKQAGDGTGEGESLRGVRSEDEKEVEHGPLVPGKFPEKGTEDKVVSLVRPGGGAA